NEFTDLSVIPVPNQKGSMGTGLDSIRRSVERAVGMDIFGEK
ncbi:MAG: V-type ATP synthase subunit F, partial [Synergistes sp.]|nr:V-type ATP synthase subunit F [Synergistes sp.]